MAAAPVTSTTKMKGTTSIWSNRMKISPKILIQATSLPTMAPTIIPRIIAVNICTARVNRISLSATPFYRYGSILPFKSRKKWKRPQTMEWESANCPTDQVNLVAVLLTLLSPRKDPLPECAFAQFTLTNVPMPLSIRGE